MKEESYLSYVAAAITVLYSRLLIALIGQNKKCYKYIAFSSNRERHKALMRFPSQNDALKQHGVPARSSG